MARALVEVIGDAASAVRALTQTSAAATTTGDAFKKLAVDAEASAKAMVAASVQRVSRFQAEAQAARALSATYVAGSTEQAAAAELAAKRTAAANRLIGASAVTAQRGSLLGAAGAAGRGLTTYVTAPAAFIGYEAVKQAINFNQQMLLLRTQAGDATDSIAQLSQQVLELAKTSPQGPTQLAQGLFHLVSLGLRGADAMNTLKISSIAAGMGIANLEDTSTALGAAVVSGIKGAQDYQQAMATLVATAGIGNMRFGDLAASVGNVLPSAAAAGITLREMGAALAVLTDRGMGAEESATRLRMALALIQRPSNAARDALKDMGVNADQLGVLIREPNGLLKVLQTLHDAMQSVGAVRGNRDLLAAFGGARSGLGIQTLVQSLDSSISSYQGKLVQLGVQTQQVGQNTQLYLESPAYKLHAALSTVQADLVKLGTALTPTVTGIATTLSKIADGFSALPGPIKTEIGVVVGVLAVGGPLMLAIKGVGTAVEGMASIFRLLPLTAGPALATVDAEIAGTGAAAAGAAGEVSALRLGLLGLGALGAIAIPITLLIERKQIGTEAHTSGQALRGGAFNPGNWIWDAIKVASGTSLSAGATTSDVVPFSPRPQAPFGSFDPSKLTSPFAAAAKAYAATHTSVSPQGSIAKFVLPYQIQVEQAKAQLTKSTADDLQALRDIVANAKKQIDSGHLSHAAYLQALQAEGSAEQQLYASQTKDAKAATAAAKKAAEAAKKAGQFALPAALQVAQARADALAALDPNTQGPNALQLRLAREEKAAAMKAINGHHLALQGMIDAWREVQQANSVIAQSLASKGSIDTYHAVSTRALTQGLNLTRDARILLEERLAQSAAHRGYAPNGPAAMGQDIHVTIKSDVDAVVTKIEKRKRQGYQRTGGRR